MYGTVAHMRLKRGQEQAMVDLQREFRPNIKGYITEYLYRLDKDSNEYIVAVVFEDRDSYMAFADNPEQDRWYQRFRALLEDDPTWNDGEIIYQGR